MIDRETKMFFIVLVLFGVIFCITSYFASNKFEKRISICTASGGIIVKTPDGWKCIDAKYLS